MVRAAKLILLGSIAIIVSSGCSGKNESSDGDSGGTAGQGTLTGGQSATSVTTGGRSSQSGTGGQVSSVGGSGTAGNTGNPTAVDFETLCRNDQAVGYVFGCLGVYQATYVNDCVAEWEALSSACASETSALAQCWMGRTALEYACTDDDRVGLAPNICVNEQASVEACR